MSKVLVKTPQECGLTSLKCINNDTNKSFPDVSVNRAKQNACKDLFKVRSQKSKTMDNNAFSSKLTNLNKSVSNTNKECQFTYCTKINISDDSRDLRYSRKIWQPGTVLVVSLAQGQD